MQGLHSSTAYATNHTQTKSHRSNTEEVACRALTERTPSHGRADVFLCSSGNPLGGSKPLAGACSRSISAYSRLVQQHGDYEIHNRRCHSCYTWPSLCHWSLQTPHSTHNSNFSL